MSAETRTGSTTSLRWGASVPALVFFAIAVAGVYLRPAFPVDETRYLSVAWEMWLGGDLLVPTRNFELYTHKPPLLFWLIQAIWSVTGVSEAAARLVGPLAAAMAILATGRLALCLWPRDPEAPARAGWALAGTAVFAVSGQLTMFDALLALCTVLAMTALCEAATTGRWRWWAATGLAIGLGGLAKGPVILIHVLPAMLAARWWAAALAPVGWREMAGGVAAALATGLVVVATWLIRAGFSAGPEWIDAVIWRQSAGRMASSFAHARPWWFYVALLPLLLFPWAFLPQLWRQVRLMRWSDPALRLAAVWILPATVAFSLISGKQLHYLVPELPAVALIASRLLRDVRPRPILPAMALGLAGVALVAVGCGLVPAGRIASLLHPSSTVVLVGPGLLAGALVISRLRGIVGASLTVLTAILGLDLLIGATGIGAGYDAHRIAALLADREEAGLALYADTYHAEFTFAGRLTRPVAELDTIPEVMDWADAHPNGLILSREDMNPLPWTPRDGIAFRGRPYAIWAVSDRTRDTARLSASPQNAPRSTGPRG